MLLEQNDKLVMIGDSVTDMGRARPVGEGLAGAIGDSYVSLVEGLFQATCPEKRIRVINMGCSGNTVVDLKERWQTDVFDLKPDWLSIMIGINDVWRQFDTPLQTEKHVLPERYGNILEELVAATKPTVKGIVLMTPYYIEPNPQDAMRARMDEYGAMVKKIAQKYNTVFVDTQAYFNEACKYVHPNAFTWDRVHPNRMGHMVIARAFMEAIGYQWLK